MQKAEHKKDLMLLLLRTKLLHLRGNGQSFRCFNQCDLSWLVYVEKKPTSGKAIAIGLQ